MRKFHADVVKALHALADRTGNVNASYADIAAEVPGSTADEIHEALIDLNNDGELPGSPAITSDMYFGRVPGGGSTFHDALKEALRKREDKRGVVSETYAALAKDLGISAGEVHQGIIQLKDDGYFEGTPMITSDQFEVRLPEED